MNICSVHEWIEIFSDQLWCLKVSPMVILGFNIEHCKSSLIWHCCLAGRALREVRGAAGGRFHRMGDSGLPCPRTDSRTPPPPAQHDLHVPGEGGERSRVLTRQPTQLTCHSSFAGSRSPWRAEGGHEYSICRSHPRAHHHLPYQFHVHQARLGGTVNAFSISSSSALYK